MKRYFIVNYDSVTKDGHIYSGLISIVMEDGKFLNRKHTEKMIKENITEVDLTDCRVILTNILEVTEEDYLDWYA